jgi:hypothetical protein
LRVFFFLFFSFSSAITQLSTNASKRGIVKMVELNQTILSSPPYDLAAGPYEEEKFWLMCALILILSSTRWR